MDRAERWAAFAGELTTNLHEIIGHGSGLVSPALNGAPEKALKEHFSAIEEARADLVALYFVADPYLAEIGVVPAEDRQDDIVLAEYEAYARNALVQLRRIREGTQIEEDHMRNRQLIVHWLLAHTSAIDGVARATARRTTGSTSRHEFRDGVGRLLAEVQRIKAEGDYDAASTLLDTYGVHFDPGAARRSRRARGRPGPAVVHGVRHAEADAGSRRPRRDRRRRGSATRTTSRHRCWSMAGSSGSIGRSLQAAVAV